MRIHEISRRATPTGKRLAVPDRKEIVLSRDWPRLLSETG